MTIGAFFSMARNGNALLFAAGKARAAFSDHSLIPLWQTFDEVIAAGGFRRSYNFVMRCIRSAEFNIVLIVSANRYTV